MASKITVRLKEIMVLYDGLAILRFTSKDKLPDFLPGMFMMISISFKDARGDKKDMKRAFSIASSPLQKDYLEFFVKASRQGSVSEALCHLKQGDQIEMSGPFGRFVLDETLDDGTVKDDVRPVFFIGAGTGIAPLMSMLRTLIGRGSKREIFLFHGASFFEGLAYHDELIKIEKENDNFHYIPSLSRVNRRWTGRKGRINDIFLEYVDVIDAQAYVCGPPEMVDDVKEKLKKKGFGKEDIKTERYC